MNRKNLIAIALLGVCFAFSPATADAGPALAKRIRAIAQDVVNKQPKPVVRINTEFRGVPAGESTTRIGCPDGLQPIAVSGGTDNGSVADAFLSGTGPYGIVRVNSNAKTVVTAQVTCADVTVVR